MRYMLYRLEIHLVDDSVIITDEYGFDNAEFNARRLLSNSRLVDHVVISRSFRRSDVVKTLRRK